MSQDTNEPHKHIWEYIHGYAPREDSWMVTFFDYNDNTLYREVPLQIIGQHGWELVSVIYAPDEQRYEYFFKRDQTQGYPPGFSNAPQN